MEMKPKTTLIVMIVAAAATAITSFFTGNLAMGGIGAFFSFLAIQAHLGGMKVWKPWFMEGIEGEDPDTSILAILAVTMEVVMIAAMIAGIGWPMLGYRFIGLCLQLSASGKLSKEINGNTHEKRRKPSPRPDKGNAGKQ